MGGDLIDESQTEICRLINEVGLRTATYSSRRFYGGQPEWAPAASRRPARMVRSRQASAARSARLPPERAAMGRRCGRRAGAVKPWRSGSIASARRKPLRDMATGMRGFFLADPDELSLLALVDQFAEDGVPGGENMFRIVGGNDRLPAALAKALGSRVQLQAVLRRVTQSRDGVTAAIEIATALQERASTISSARCRPRLCEMSFLSRRCPTTSGRPSPRSSTAHATKTALQFDRATWRKRGKPRAFGTPLPIGAVWDGNEEQRATAPERDSPNAGILTLLAGGGASAATREMLAARRPVAPRARALVAGSGEHRIDGVDDHQLGARAMVPRRLRVLRPAVSRRRFASALARPWGRIFFAGEHTSIRWQGYMNGAVETGLRAAEEVLRANGVGSGLRAEGLGLGRRARA